MGSRPICYFWCTVNLFSIECIYREVINQTQLQSTCRGIINIIILYEKKKEFFNYVAWKAWLSFYGNIKEQYGIIDAGKNEFGLQFKEKS